MKTNKDFDCVKMMRDIREKVNSEIVKMDSAQIVEYFRIKSAEFEKKYSQPVKNYPVSPSSTVFPSVRKRSGFSL